MSSHQMCIGVMAPARAIDKPLADSVVALGTAHGVKIVFHEQCYQRQGHFAGSDAARSQALYDLATNPNYDAVWFARGGYGSFRIDDAVLQRMKQNPAANRKIYMGYSDTGALLARLYALKIGQPVHGPMPADLLRDGGTATLSRALQFFLARAESPPEAHLPQVAFNITVLAHLCGTDWLPDLTGHTLLLEDIGEYQYALDRSMFTITSNPKIRGVTGIRLGRVSGIPVNDIDFEMTAEDIARDWCQRANIPYLGRADIGHDTDNAIIMFGPTKTTRKVSA